MMNIRGYLDSLNLRDEYYLSLFAETVHPVVVGLLYLVKNMVEITFVYTKEKTEEIFDNHCYKRDGSDQVQLL